MLTQSDRAALEGGGDSPGRIVRSFRFPKNLLTDCLPLRYHLSLSGLELKIFIAPGRLVVSRHPTTAMQGSKERSDVHDNRWELGGIAITVSAKSVGSPNKSKLLR